LPFDKLMANGKFSFFAFHCFQRLQPVFVQGKNDCQVG
jgi:hypothetical protein